MKRVGVALIALMVGSSAVAACEVTMNFRDNVSAVETIDVFQDGKGVHFRGRFKPSRVGIPLMWWGSGGKYWNAVTRPVITEEQEIEWVVNRIGCGHSIQYQAFLISGNLVKFGEQKTFTTQPCDRSAAAAEGMPL